MLNGSSSSAALEGMVLVTLYIKNSVDVIIVYHQDSSDFLLIILSARHTHLTTLDT